MEIIANSLFSCFFSDSLLFDFDFFNMVGIETVGKSLSHIGLLSFEGEEMLASSNFELSDSLIFLDENSYINMKSYFSWFLMLSGSLGLSPSEGTP